MHDENERPLPTGDGQLCARSIDCNGSNSAAHECRSAASTCRSRLFRNPPKPVVQAFANWTPGGQERVW